jgi:hypothetical protein
MTTLTYQKTVYASYLVGIGIVITMPDIVFGLVLELLHVMFELAHLFFELFESALDHVVEHIFHTDVKETQIIVFYLMVVMASGAIYCFCRSISNRYRESKAYLLAHYQQNKARLFSYWSEQSFFDRIKLFLLLNAGLVCFILFGF